MLFSFIFLSLSHGCSELCQDMTNEEGGVKNVYLTFKYAAFIHPFPVLFWSPSQIHYRVKLLLDLRYTCQHKKRFTNWRLSLFWKQSFSIVFDFQSALSLSTHTHYVSYEFKLFRLHLRFLLDIISVHTNRIYGE